MTVTPVTPSRYDTPPGHRWVSCSKAEFGPVGYVAHVIPVGGITTVCGATATFPEIWRGDSRKPECHVCVARITGRGLTQ